VFRGFLDHTNQLKFVSDRRSEKATQILTQPWGEVCWYFPNSREQFRLSGDLTLVGENSSDIALHTAREQQWQALSDAARSQFAWPDPGKPKANAPAFDLSSPDPLQPLPNFCLLLLNPLQVDHLELRGNPQNRCLYRQESTDTGEAQWLVQATNP
jgi:PPOX class probable FMN-dependent enzyme